MRKYLLLLAILIGCSDNHIRVTYGEWETKQYKVWYIYKDKAILSLDGSNIKIDAGNLKQGDIVTKQIRKVWTSRCQDNHCELIKTEIEIK